MVVCCMKKIGIISELDFETLNYGNRLQSYALNFYLSKNNTLNVDSLMLNFKDQKYTIKSSFVLLKKAIKKIMVTVGLLKMQTEKTENTLLSKRFENSKKFTDQISTKQINSINDLKENDYDIMIVGSDIVWEQNNYFIDRLKFLDFDLNQEFKKISYAASFGSNWIPKQNHRYIKKCLYNFEAVSVRERASLDLLKSIDVENTAHVCDPTMLITADEWSKVIEPVKEITEKYVFVYMLGCEQSQYEAIKKFSEKNNFKIATIPTANNIYSSVGIAFGDYNIMDTGPAQWLWLIKNAEYVITDSFHGVVFSTIFSKRFIVVKRFAVTDMNIRMTDFLDTIDEQDKFVDITEVDSLEGFVWDYEKIHKITDEFVKKSKKYLERALNT